MTGFLKGMDPEPGSGTNVSTSSTESQASFLPPQGFLRGMHPEDGHVVQKKFYNSEHLEMQARDTVAWILDTDMRLSDDQIKLQKLHKLEGSIEAAMSIYVQRFDQDYGNIQATMMNVKYMPELRPEVIELQTLFTGLQNADISGDDVVLFRDYMEALMEQSPEIQADILWFLELVHDCIISKSNDLSIRTNPLKNLLFYETDIPYKDWILRVFANFERDENGMKALMQSIRNAEAPQVGLKTFIRHLYDTKSEVMDGEDRAWLESLYTQWPDEQETNKPNTISFEDKKKRDSIAKKYFFDHSEMGKTNAEAIDMAQEFRDFTWYKNQK